VSHQANKSQNCFILCCNSERFKINLAEFPQKIPEKQRWIEFFNININIKVKGYP